MPTTKNTAAPAAQNQIVGEVINVGDLMLAKVENDNADAYTPGTPYMLAPTGSVARDTPTNSKTRYYSGRPYFVDTAEGETKLTLVVPGLTVQRRAEILGKPFDKDKGMLYDDGKPGNDYFALGYPCERPDGVVEVVWFLKGKLAIPKQEGETKTDSINEKPLTLEYTAVTTIHQFQVTTDRKGGVKLVEADTTHTAFTTANVDEFLAKVQTPPEPAATTAPETGGEG